MKREPVSKKTRFEVFKRDKFCCQYCGRKAPDVLLHADHIHPASKGGVSDILNLITACSDCNNGKGARLLDVNSELEKQRGQIEDLQHRREQLEMLIEWRNAVSDLDGAKLKAVQDRFQFLTGYTVTEFGAAFIRKLLKSNDVGLVLNAVDSSCDAYLEWGENGCTSESAGKALDKIGAFVRIEREKLTRPHYGKLIYIQGILRIRTGKRWDQFIDAIDDYYKAGLDLEFLEDLAKGSDSWDEFRDSADDAKYWQEKKNG